VTVSKPALGGGASSECYLLHLMLLTDAGMMLGTVYRKVTPTAGMHHRRFRDLCCTYTLSKEPTHKTPNPQNIYKT